MILFLIDIVRRKLRLLLFTLSLLALVGRVEAGSAAREWLDENTAVTVTAQKSVSVFAQRKALPIGSYFNFAGIGAFEINQMGTRHQYLSLMVWSTQLRTREEQTKFEDNFETFVIWADDQPLTFKRWTRKYETLPVSAPVFKVPGATNGETYYQISLEQLAALAAAKKLRLTPTANTDAEQVYQPQRDQLAVIVAFANEIAKTNPSMRPDAR